MMAGMVTGVDVLLVKSDPGIGKSLLGLLQRGDRVDILLRNGLYTKICFDDVVGYVRSRFVVDVPNC